MKIELTQKAKIMNESEIRMHRIQNLVNAFDIGTSSPTEIEAFYREVLAELQRIKKEDKDPYMIELAINNEKLVMKILAGNSSQIDKK